MADPETVSAPGQNQGSGAVLTPVPNAAPKIAASKVEEAIRELIRAETPGMPGHVPSPEKPRKRDIVFLLLSVANLILLVWLIPPDAFKDERIAFLKELIPWVFGSLFVLATTWYKHQILKVSRNLAFRVLDIALAVLLAVIWFPLLSVGPLVDPMGTQLKVDTDKEPRDLTKPIRVSFRGHTFKLQRNEDKSNERSFTLTKRDLLRATFEDWRPRWSLLYPTRISSNREGARVTIKREVSPFDRDFLRQDFLDSIHLRRLDDSTMQFVLPPEMNTATTKLPVGRYGLTLASPECKEKQDTLEIAPAEKYAFSVRLECSLR